MSTFLRGLAAVGVAILAAGCASLGPDAEVRARLPEERLLAVDGSDVYVERCGQGEAVVLIHGFGWLDRSRQRQAWALANQVKTELGVLAAAEGASA